MLAKKLVAMARRFLCNDRDFLFIIRLNEFEPFALVTAILQLIILQSFNQVGVLKTLTDIELTLRSITR